MSEIKFSRYQYGGCFSLDTSKSSWYESLFMKYNALTSNLNGKIIDPFARSCEWGDITNDINPEFKTTYNLDALEFSKILIDKNEIARIILFDPPFSFNQAERYIEGEMKNLYTDPAFISNLSNNLCSIIEPNGYFIKLGYNSTKPSKNMSLVEIMNVNIGSCRNDVIVSIWKNVQHTLF